jgi:hypothetical protein
MIYDSLKGLPLLRQCFYRISLYFNNGHNNEHSNEDRICYLMILFKHLCSRTVDP